MHKARSTDVSNNTTPVSLSSESNKFKGRASTKETSSGLDQRRHGGKNIHVSAGEQIVSSKNRTPGKSYIYHMDASFCKDTMNNTNSQISDNNFPTISQTGSASTGKQGYGLKKKGPKSSKTDTSLKSKSSGKETVAKRGKKDSSSSKNKPHQEYLKLKNEGVLKYMPKLSIDIPF
jgi:hypothetical protein